MFKVVPLDAIPDDDSRPQRKPRRASVGNVDSMEIWDELQQSSDSDAPRRSVARARDAHTTSLCMTAMCEFVYRGAGRGSSGVNEQGSVSAVDVRMVVFKSTWCGACVHAALRGSRCKSIVRRLLRRARAIRRRAAATRCTA